MRPRTGRARPASPRRRARASRLATPPPTPSTRSRGITRASPIRPARASARPARARTTTSFPPRASRNAAPRGCSSDRSSEGRSAPPRIAEARREANALRNDADAQRKVAEEAKARAPRRRARQGERRRMRPGRILGSGQARDGIGGSLHLRRARGRPRAGPRRSSSASTPSAERTPRRPTPSRR